MHPRLAVRGDLADHADGGRLGRALPIGGVWRLRGAARDVGLGRAAMNEAAQGGPVTAAGVAAHDEAGVALLQQVDQPGGRGAAIEQQRQAMLAEAAAAARSSMGGGRSACGESAPGLVKPGSQPVKT